jgi:hypothetical protein
MVLFGMLEQTQLGEPSAHQCRRIGVRKSASDVVQAALRDPGPEFDIVDQSRHPV